MKGKTILINNGYLRVKFSACKFTLQALTKPLFRGILFTSVFFLYSIVYAVVPASATNSNKSHTILLSDSTRPDSTGIRISKDALKSKVQYHAEDSIIFDVEGKGLFLYGKAELTYENLVLKAERISIDWNTNMLYAHGIKDTIGDSLMGTPAFTVDGENYRSEEMVYNFKNKKGKMIGVRTTQGEGFLYGKAVKRDENENLYMKNGWYTTCSEPHPHFQINVSEVKVIPNKRIITGPANLVISDIPTPAVVPFGFFPIQKGQRSGFILPTYSDDYQRGFGLRDGGYYFNINDYVDLKLTGSIFSRGAWIANIGSSYAKRYHYRGNFRVSYNRDLTGERGTYTEQIANLINVNWTHTQDGKARPGTNFSASVNAGSSNYQRRNSLNTGEMLNNELTSSVNYSKSFGGGKYVFSLNANQRQNVTTRSLDLTLPNANFFVNNIYPFKRKEQIGSVRWYEKITTNYALDIRNSLSTYDSLLFKAEQWRPDVLNEKLSTGASHSIPLATSFMLLKYFTFTPSANLTQYFYPKTIEKLLIKGGGINGTDTNITQWKNDFRVATAYSMNFGVNTRFYGMYKFNGRKLLAMRHTVMPSIGFAYKPDYGLINRYGYYQQYEVANRGYFEKYSIFERSTHGGPAAGRVGSLNTSVNNSFEIKVRNPKDTINPVSKISIIDNLALSAGYNFFADSLKLSPLNLSARSLILKKINIDFGASFSPYQLDTVRGTVRSVNRYLIQSPNPKLANMQTARLAFSFNLNDQANKKRTSNRATEGELADINRFPDRYVDFNIPWNLNVMYNFGYTMRNPFDASATIKSQFTQNVSLNGDFNLTPKWKVGGDAYFDVQTQQFTYMSVNVYRDLHCWDMQMNIRPFGTLRGFNFTIKVKSPVLSDLKLVRRFDNRFN